ncbi:MAG: hypothetical protein NXI16_01440 [Alphaproteobacteria bacterium]|nr:hypothetical protein [Alphaproteobacteria bacterium]
MSQERDNALIEAQANIQTRLRSSNEDEYDIYLACADDGNGIDITTGRPLKTYEEWLNS